VAVRGREGATGVDLVVGCLVVAGHGALLGSAMATRVMACSGGRERQGSSALGSQEGGDSGDELG
jgi:hypothetical protein